MNNSLQNYIIFPKSTKIVTNFCIFLPLFFVPPFPTVQKSKAIPFSLS